MLERKDFDRSITLDDKEVLKRRVRRLTFLLGEPRSSDFRVPQCVGLIDDPDNYCWWLVFRFSTSLHVDQPLPSQPVSLLSLYRHPNYQGEAAQGYKIQYDIYSVGLVLMEICMWEPLTRFWEAGAPLEQGLEKQASLSPGCEAFRRDEAIALQKQRAHDPKIDITNFPCLLRNRAVAALA
jgi:hypothetical protein